MHIFYGRSFNKPVHKICSLPVNLASSCHSEWFVFTSQTIFAGSRGPSPQSLVPCWLVSSPLCVQLPTFTSLKKRAMRRSRSSKTQTAQETGGTQSKTGMWPFPLEFLACRRVSSYVTSVFGTCLDQVAYVIIVIITAVAALMGSKRFYWLDIMAQNTVLCFCLQSAFTPLLNLTDFLTMRPDNAQLAITADCGAIA